MSAQALALKQLLVQRFPDAVPVVQRTAAPVATGIEALDRILPGGGFPRGRLSVWRPLGASSTLLRNACHTVRAAGERAVWIDGMGTIAGTFWETGPVLIRPRDRRNALRAAEELLQSGAFGLIVLSGAEPEGREAVRLSRAVREGGGAFVAITESAAFAGLRLTSCIHPGAYHWRRTPFGEPALVDHVVVSVRALAAGWNASTSIRLPVVPHELRLSLDPALVDRRGVAR